MKKESTLESVKKADSDSDLSDYLVPVCLIVTLTVIVTMALCMARNTIRGAINTVRTVCMGQHEDVQTGGELGRTIDTYYVQTDGGELGRTIKTYVQKDSGELGRTIKTDVHTDGGDILSFCTSSFNKYNCTSNDITLFFY